MFWGAKVQKKVISHRQMQNYYQGNTLAIVPWRSTARRKAAFLLNLREIIH
jgi:hypothetical protein